MAGRAVDFPITPETPDQKRGQLLSDIMVNYMSSSVNKSQKM